MSRETSETIRAHVLVVDDDASLAKAMAATFEARGLIVHVARSGEKALELVAERRPAVVVLDIVLPGLNGFQLCRQLRSSEPELPILMFSGKHEPADELWAAEVGATELFRKPSGLNALADRVAELARR